MKVFLTLFAFLLLSLNTHSQQNNAWDFPIKPGSEEWKELFNQKLKVQACQVPDSLIYRLTTENLFDLYLRYPLLINIIAFQTFEMGINDLKRNFNGINELLSRTNASDVILKRYFLLSVYSFNLRWTAVQRGNYAFALTSLELLICQNEVLNTLKLDEKILILNDAVQKLQDKLTLSQDYGELSLKSNCYLITKLIRNIWNSSYNISQKELDSLCSFSNSTVSFQENKIDEIIFIANQIISQK